MLGLDDDITSHHERITMKILAGLTASVAITEAERILKKNRLQPQWDQLRRESSRWLNLTASDYSLILILPLVTSLEDREERTASTRAGELAIVFDGSTSAIFINKNGKAQLLQDTTRPTPEQSWDYALQLLGLKVYKPDFTGKKYLDYAGKLVSKI